jgi:cytoskeletal protein CcmA (bactofilin family)
MNHVDEITCLLFLEGQLDRAQSVEFDVHLKECASCRVLLSALQQESLLLSNALLEDEALLGESLLDKEPLPERLRTSPWEQAPRPWSRQSPQEFASWTHWAWLLGFVTAAGACFSAWVDVLQPWLYQYDQTGIQSGSLLIRFLMSIIFWEGWPNMLNRIQYAVCVLVATLMGIGVLVLLRAHWRKAAAITAAIAGLVVMLGSPTSANAAEIRRGNDVYVPSGETVHNDLIAAGESVRIDGTVEGDLITFSQNVTVNGHVTGDIIAFGDMIRIEGPVDGNIRCFCNTLSLDSTVAKNLTAFASHVEINRPASVNGGVIAFVGSLIADGKVTRDLLLFANNTTLNGAVGGDIRLRGRQLVVGPTAQVGGRLQVTSNNQPEISDSAKLARSLEYQFVPQRQPNRLARAFAGLYLIRQAVSYGVAFLCGLLLIKLFPGLFAAVGQATRRVGLSMSVGALVLIAGTPLLIFSILLVLAGAGAGFAALMLYVPILYASQLFVGAWIGEKVLSKSAASHIGQLAAGLLILRLLGMIPFLGFFVWTAAFLWGAGAIFVALWTRTRLEPLPPAVA